MGIVRNGPFEIMEEVLGVRKIVLKGILVLDGWLSFSEITFS